MGTVPLTGPQMKHPTHAVFLILLLISSCQAKFFDLQEDGSIECETKADCPNDVLIIDKANNTVREFRCLPRVDVDNEESGESLVGLELSNINVQSTIESEGSSEGGDDLSN